ncbi:DUF3102 domain-containing protein, partial [Xanthobacter sp. V2C-8]|uniref:DUF3102 domain-containing protein n=1 Tax=Xanthobacter albus TaxID=3119929 RepID=UPI00372A2E2C
EDPTYLAREINYAHQQVVDHGKSMLAYAAEAGRHLIAVKGMLQHGEFKPWIERNCACTYSQAARYMKVAKNLGDKTFEADLDAGIEAFLGYDKPKTPHPTPTDLSQDGAAHALKLHALVERGATEGERDVARRKLEAFAKGFRDPQSGQAYTAEALVGKAQDLLPNSGKTSDQIELDKAEAEASARTDAEHVIVEPSGFCPTGA